MRKELTRKIVARAQLSHLALWRIGAVKPTLPGVVKFHSLRHSIKVVKRSGHRECGLNEAKSWADDNGPMRYRGGKFALISPVP
jgi:hypothetical protein